jgi:2-dehydro-3-deoxyphosphogluconate aldolase/(4S)-4-hydroxy-2-oxoglutarate aldolase
MSIADQVMDAAYPVMPVMVIDRVEDAVPMAQALSKGGVNVYEITLRTAAALESVREISQALPDAWTGVGTLNTPDQVEEVLKAGAKFAISPGATDTLYKEAAAQGLQLLPGVMTPSDIIRALEHGINRVKFFPAVPAGGINMLKAFAGPFGDVKFCPTGGISVDTFRDFLALPNVKCVGGSWLTPSSAVKSGNWDEVTRLCVEARKMVEGN